MRFYYTSLLLAASSVAAVATPQAPDLGALPQCAQTAALTVIQAIGCSLLSVSCFCQQPSFLQSLENVITTKCGASDAQAAMEFGRTQCAAAGFPLAANSSPAPSGPASAPASASASAAPALASAPITTTTVDDAMTVTSTLMSTSATPVQSSSSSSAPVAPAIATVVPAGNSSNSTWMTNNTMVQPAPFVGAADSVKMGGVAAGLLGLAIAFATL